MEEEEAWILITGFSNMEIIGQLHKRSFNGVLGRKHNCSQRRKKEEELGKAIIVLSKQNYEDIKYALIVLILV